MEIVAAFNMFIKSETFRKVQWKWMDNSVPWTCVYLFVL